MEHSEDCPESIAETAIDYPLEERQTSSDDSETIRVDRE